MRLPYEAEPTVLTGPGGVKLTLDVREVHPDDPGAGTPALVELGNASASYDCATTEGEVTSDRGGAVSLSVAQLAWLDGQSRHVEEVLRQGAERDAIKKSRTETARAEDYEVGFYLPTEAFKAIPEHVAVMRKGTGELIAVTGPSEPGASAEACARLFCAAPKLRDALEVLMRRVEHYAPAMVRNGDLDDAHSLLRSIGVEVDL